MKTPTRINIFGVSGGVGTTSNALMLAVEYARRGDAVLLQSVQDEEMRIYAATTVDEVKIGKGYIHIVPLGTEDIVSIYDVIICDYGRSSSALVDTSALNIWMMRNSYLDLVKIKKIEPTIESLVLVIEDSERALRTYDIDEALDDHYFSIASLTYTPRVSRALDAGTVTSERTSRDSKQIFEIVDDFIQNYAAI